MNAHGHILVFDDKGYYVGRTKEAENQTKSIKFDRKQKILDESIQTKKYGKFLLLENIKKDTKDSSSWRILRSLSKSDKIVKVQKSFGLGKLKEWVTARA